MFDEIVFCLFVCSTNASILWDNWHIIELVVTLWKLFYTFWNLFYIRNNSLARLWSFCWRHIWQWSILIAFTSGKIFRCNVLITPNKLINNNIYGMCILIKYIAVIFWPKVKNKLLYQISINIERYVYLR